MAWDLEIHHIDVGQGDATLFVAREAGVSKGRVRSALIDGGIKNKGKDVHDYIKNRAYLTSLDVMVATHYDQDHINGLTYLLTNYADTYDHTVIFDQGWLQNPRTEYIEPFLRAINGNDNSGTPAKIFNGKKPNRIRPTQTVSADGFNSNHISISETLLKSGPPVFPINGKRSIKDAPHFLIGKELLWWGPDGENTGFTGAGPSPGAEGGPPTIKCIAANGFVAQAGKGKKGDEKKDPENLAKGVSQDPNAKSLAFVVEHNGFRYYLGGDIESAQEDGRPGVNGIRHYLNPDDDLAGRVHAMKVSHHGSAKSTSGKFVDHLRPKAAFISCGNNNTYELPDQQVLKNLEGSPRVVKYFLTEDRSTSDYCNRVVAAAEQMPLIPGGACGESYTAKAVIAGAWGKPTSKWGRPPDRFGNKWPEDGSASQIDGHIVLTVTASQSKVGDFNVTFCHPPYPPGKWSLTKTTWYF